MPDLDLIKQGEQGVRDRRGRFAGGDRAILPAGRAAAATTSTALLGYCSPVRVEALTRKGVELGSPATRRHCGCASNASSGRIANARSNSR
jgi:hypothetical protein